jgi:hypothetical protein
MDEKEMRVKTKSQENLINGSTSVMYNNNNQAIRSVNESSGLHRTNVPEKVFRPDSPHSILNIESRPLLSREAPIGRSSDRDENKYLRRKTPQEIFSRWSRQFYSPSSRPPYRRTWFIILSGFCTFLALLYIMYHFGRNGNDFDESNVHYDE